MSRSLQEIVAFMKSLKKISQKARAISMIELIEIARGEALKNARKQFIGRNDRKLSGRLFNSIFGGYKTTANGIEGYIGTKGIPYGGIHEYGGTIKPKNARNLWLKNWTGVPKELKRITPTEFFNLMKQDKSRFALFKSKAGNQIAWYNKKTKTKSQWIPLFFLKKSVEIPSRPYLRPAIQVATKRYGSIYEKHFNHLVGGA